MTKDEVRKQFPKVAEVIDQIRKHFPNAKVIWAKENDKEIGKKC